MDHIVKLERAMLTRAFVFVYLFLFTSAESQGCTNSTVTRISFGDRIVFYNYAGTCNRGVNPCKQVNGVWRSSGRNCSCQCLRSNSTYREDLKFCVKNEESRDGCTLLFDRERTTNSLRVFNKSSSLKLITRLPRENCRVKGTAYVKAYGTAVWKQFKADQMPFYIRHKDRKRIGHDHFLEWKDNPVAELFGKIVKVNIECPKTRRRGGDTVKQLCIVFKVKGTTNLPCPVPTTSSPTLMTTIPKTTEAHISNQTTKKPLPPITDVVIVTVEEPNTTPDPSIIDEGNKQSHDVGGKKSGLPIWLIAVVAGGAVIATLSITVIIWLCWKMKRRSHKRRTTRRARLGNSLNNPEDDTVIAFAPSGGGPGIDEAGYASVVNPPGRKGYAHLKPALDRRSRSEYQKLLKPTQDRSGYLVPLEEVTTATDSPTESNIYSEAQSPKPPQNKPKSKEYDYAKPEGIIVLTASRSSLDNLDSLRDADSEPPNEADYVETRQHNGPSSPLYAVVEGPNSPLKSPGVPPEGAPMKKELNDPAADYIEVLPDTENVNKDSET